MGKQQQISQKALERFEHKASELVSLALALTEKRIASLKRPSSTSKAQASAALAVKHALEAFMTIAKLEE